MAAVVPDDQVAGAEIVVDYDTGARLGITAERYVLIAHAGSRGTVETAVRSLTDRQIRVRAPGESPFLRHADAVLPQALIKEAFGEFSVTIGAVGPLGQDPRWRERFIVRASVPLLGEISCHVALLPSLEGAMAELRQVRVGAPRGELRGVLQPPHHRR